MARSNHTVTVIGNKAYIFGGDTAGNVLASNDVHAVTLEKSGKPEMDYSMIPALSDSKNKKTPLARSNHAACAFHGNVAVYGGSDSNGELIDEKSSVWLFSPERKTWDIVESSQSNDITTGPGPRRNAYLFAHAQYLILFGGIDSSGAHASDLWQFDVAARSWTQLPTAPAATSNAALANGQLWLVSGTDALSSQLHHMSLSSSTEEKKWISSTFPTNPLAPGPRARHNGALLPVTTGWGRNYLVHVLGARDSSSASDSASDVPSTTDPEDASHSRDITQYSDTWALQLPSSDVDPKPAATLKQAVHPAKLKDAVRSVFGAETGHLSWAEAVVQVPGDQQLDEQLEGTGKLHPGPRAFFGADVVEAGHSVVFWGGLDAKGERVGDGWIAQFE